MNILQLWEMHTRLSLIRINVQHTMSMERMDLQREEEEETTSSMIMEEDSKVNTNLNILFHIFVGPMFLN